MVAYNFTCPECKCEILQEVLVNVVMTSTTRSVFIDDQGVELDYDEDSCTDGGSVNRYQCYECGTVLKTKSDQVVNSDEDLKEWMEEHGTVQLDDDNDYLNSDNMLN